MVPANEQLEADRAELKEELKGEAAVRAIGAHFCKDIKKEDAELRKTLEKSVSEIEEEPCLMNVYGEFIGKHDSLILALAYRLAKPLSSDLVNCSELSELFKGYFAYNHDIRKEIGDDLRAAEVRNVRTLLYSQGFLVFLAHKVAHKLWSDDTKNLALFIQKRVSEVFSVDIHPEEKTKGLITVCAADNSGKASASSGNIQDGIRRARHHTNGGPAKKLSSLAKIFIPIAFALLVASLAIWYSSSSTSL